MSLAKGTGIRPEITFKGTTEVNPSHGSSLDSLLEETGDLAVVQQMVTQTLNSDDSEKQIRRLAQAISFGLTLQDVHAILVEEEGVTEEAFFLYYQAAKLLVVDL